MEWVEEPIDTSYTQDPSERLTCLIDFCKTLCFIKTNPCTIN